MNRVVSNGGELALAYVVPLKAVATSTGACLKSTLNTATCGASLNQNLKGKDCLEGIRRSDCIFECNGRLIVGEYDKGIEG